MGILIHAWEKYLHVSFSNIATLSNRIRKYQYGLR